MDDSSRLTRGQSERLHARRKARNWALFAVLIAFVVLFYAISIVKMSRHAPPDSAAVAPSTGLLDSGQHPAPAQNPGESP